MTVVTNTSRTAAAIARLDAKPTFYGRQWGEGRRPASGSGRGPLRSFRRCSGCQMMVLRDGTCNRCEGD